MKISLEWLRDYLDHPLDGETAGEALTHGGLPVEVIEAVGDDTVIDVEVTSNRGDCLSHVGVARELGALLDKAWKSPVAVVASATASSSDSPVMVSIESPDLCSFYSARVIRNVKVGPSPSWMRRRLEAVGLRSINNIVDITNYVMHELGQPLHAFDLDKLSGNKIIVRTAREGEKLTSIDGHERKLTPAMLVIADAEKPVALAGVMGGLSSEVGEGTTNILLESARFDPLCVRKTARGLQMMSDSSYRFERGIPAGLPLMASARAAELIVQLAGGELSSGVAEAGNAAAVVKELRLRPARLAAVLGVGFSNDEILGALGRLGFGARVEGEAILATVPWWRMDVKIEVDLIEEVARIIGYERIPEREEISIRAAALDEKAAAMDLLHGVLVGSGYFEAITFSFVTDQLAGDFTPVGVVGLARAAHAVRKADGRLRPSLLPGLLEAVRRNETAGTAGAKLYEVGSTFVTLGDGRVEEMRKLALVGSEDLREVRGVVEAMLGRLDAAKAVNVVADDRAGFAKGACGRVEWAGGVVGWLGRVDGTVLGKVDLRGRPCAAELDLALMVAGALLVPQLRSLPKFPAIRRDLSLIVPEAITYERIAGVIELARPEMLEEVEYVTTYRGKPLEKSQKSVTVQLVFRSPTATLTSEQVEQSVQRVIESAATEIGAVLRA